MGCMLSSPVELIRVQRHGSSAYRCAVAEMQGWRSNHEDAHEMKCDNISAACFVLDGHGGDHAANFGAPELVRELTGKDGLAGSSLPHDERIEEGFAAVDARLRTIVGGNQEKESGSTVIGTLVARQADGTYNLKLLNCGDSRGLVVRGPEETEEIETCAEVRWPGHLIALAEEKIQALPACGFPLVVESEDHKPDHPTEKARIVEAGGHVTAEDPPRLDGNLAVSRGLGDFEYKRSTDRSVPEQKVSVVPDIYEVRGLKPGSLVVLGCDGVWDVLSSLEVANIVHAALKMDPAADLGEICAGLVKLSLARNSRDNVTVMILHFTDGSDWAEEPHPDEIKEYGKLLQENSFDDEVRKQYVNFLKRARFPLEPVICAVCQKWIEGMKQCPCKLVHYCSRHCQKKHWKTHKTECPEKTASTSSPSGAKTKGGKK